MPANYYQDGADFYHEERGHVWSAPFKVKDSDRAAGELARAQFIALHAAGELD